jgi:hypothetical protein
LLTTFIKTKAIKLFLYSFDHFLVVRNRRHAEDLIKELDSILVLIFTSRITVANTDSTMLVSTVPSKVLLFSIVFKFIAMIIGVLGNITVIIYAIFLRKEKTPASYFVGNLALADLLVCITFYPIWINEFMQTILKMDSDQDLFCKLSRSTIWSLLFASVATLLAITVDRYLYIVKPFKYSLIVTKRRVILAIAGIWLTACCLFIVLQVHIRRYDFKFRSLCRFISNSFFGLMNIFVCGVPFILNFILNFPILNVARKQRQRILAETTTTVSNEQSSKRLIDIVRLLVGLKAAKTLAILVAVLTFCVLTPTVVGLALEHSCSDSCLQMWHLVFHYEFFGINSIVNPFIYGMRHIKQRKGYGNILFKILRCNKLRARNTPPINV